MTIVNVVAMSEGVYFGECLGYCEEMVSVTADRIRYTTCAQMHRERYPDVVVDISIERKEWEELLRLIDFGVLDRLPDRIGDPDATDQGGEWVEVFDGEVKKRVDFELGASVPGVDDLLTKLRELRSGLSAMHKPR